MNKFQLVIFDLDGTLLDTSEGIFNSVRYAEKGLSLPPIASDRLKEFVGPPPKNMYKSLYNLSEELAQKAVQLHREYGKLYAIFEAKIYAGMVEVLQVLKEKGYKIGVATLKSQPIANKILQHFELADYFDVIIGMNEQESLTKAQTIQTVMEITNVSNPKDVVLVGDSEYDLIGAREMGISFVPALYGFGFKEEIYGEKILKNIKEPNDLMEIL